VISRRPSQVTNQIKKVKRINRFRRRLVWQEQSTADSSTKESSTLRASKTLLAAGTISFPIPSPGSSPIRSWPELSRTLEERYRAGPRGSTRIETLCISNPSEQRHAQVPARKPERSVTLGNQSCSHSVPPQPLWHMNA
jgi:hypothetical protein